MPRPSRAERLLQALRNLRDLRRAYSPAPLSPAPPL